MGEGQEIVFHINGWLLAGLSVTGFGTAIYIIYLLLIKLAHLTVEGIKHEIVDCQEALLREISVAHSKAELAHQHAENAHKRVGRLETVLIANGVKTSKEKVG